MLCSSGRSQCTIWCRRPRRTTRRRVSWPVAHATDTTGTGSQQRHHVRRGVHFVGVSVARSERVGTREAPCEEQKLMRHWGDDRCRHPLPRDTGGLLPSQVARCVASRSSRSGEKTSPPFCLGPTMGGLPVQGKGTRYLAQRRPPSLAAVARRRKLGSATVFRSHRLCARLVFSRTLCGNSSQLPLLTFVL